MQLAVLLALALQSGTGTATAAPDAPPVQNAVAPAPPAAASLPYVIKPQASAGPSDAPRILEVDLNDHHLHSHGMICMRVVTTPDVVEVTSGAQGRSGVVPNVAPGLFYAEHELPGITALAEIFPLNLVFTARTRDGKTASISVPVVMGG